MAEGKILQILYNIVKKEKMEQAMPRIDKDPSSLSRRVRKMENQKSKWVATDCTICYHSCGMNVLVEDGRIKKVEGLKDHPLNQGPTLS